MVFRAYDRNGIRFALWSGHGRDPEVAYLDARLLAIATSELGTSGLQLHGSGVSFNVLGGERAGEIDPAALHRMVHAAPVGGGKMGLELPEPCAEPLALDGLCETAARDPRPEMPAEPTGSFALESDFALQWVIWDDGRRDRPLRRAVYADDRYLLEAASGPDGRVRAWPARGLMPHGLELVTPTASELSVVEERITGLVNASRHGG